MRLYVDLETLQLIEGPGFRNPVNELRFKRGDAAQLEVVFLTGGTTPAHIGDPLTLELQFGIKPRNRYDVGYLVHEAVWIMPDPGEVSPIYLCSPSFNTEELDSAMQVGSSTGSELSEITLMGEITWREGLGEPTSTRTFTVLVENDVNRGTEGVPVEAEPPYPLPGDLELIARKGEANGYAGLDGSGRVPAHLLRTEKPAGMVRMVSVMASGAVGPQVKTSTGYATIRWWDGATSVVGTGDPETGISFSKAAPTSGSWGDASPKEIYIWPSNSAGVQSGDITWLTTPSDGLAVLDVSGLDALTFLDCSTNKLTSLDVTGLPSLATLNCGSNDLATLELRNLPLLVDLNCTANLLTALDLSSLPGLTALKISNNSLLASVTFTDPLPPLTSLEMQACTSFAEFDFSGFDLLQYLDISYMAIPGELDLSHAIDLATLALSSSAWTKVTVFLPGLTGTFAGDYSALEEIVCVGARIGSTASMYLNDSQVAAIALPVSGGSIYLSYNQLDAAALDALYASLLTMSGSGTLYVTGNPGAGGGSGSDPTIATAKGWTVNGDTV